MKQTHTKKVYNHVYSFYMKVDRDQNIRNLLRRQLEASYVKCWVFVMLNFDNRGGFRFFLVEKSESNSENDDDDDDEVNWLKGIIRREKWEIPVYPYEQPYRRCAGLRHSVI